MPLSKSQEFIFLSSKKKKKKKKLDFCALSLPGLIFV